MRPHASLTPETMTVGQLLSQICRMNGHHLRTHMGQLGLHRGQGFALVHLWENDGMPQRELAQAMHIRAATVTNMLQRMERSGWIERKRDENDQRVVRIFLTDKAKTVRRQAQAVFAEMEDELCALYSESERETFRELLIRLHRHFLQTRPSHHPPLLPGAERRPR